MKRILPLLLLTVFTLTGCVASVNTKDVTRITVTTTGLRIGVGTVDRTPEFIAGRSQVDYIKVPTGLNGTNASASDAATVPQAVFGYELNTSSPLFGRGAMTATTSTGTNGVQTLLGGQHAPINGGTGTNAVAIGNPVNK